MRVQIDIGDDSQDHLIEGRGPARDRNGTAIMLRLDLGLRVPALD
jgi:hypothetical protein